MRKIIDGNTACSLMSYLFTEIASIYPITPSSTMASNIDNYSNNGKLNLFGNKVKVVEMQSEAGAAASFHGSLLTGSLSSTYTASQGLLLMIPNMYKIAGECLPGVIHVASRTIATHALSIFGDHQDIYAARDTGFCFLSSSSVQDAYLLSAVAHLSAIEGSLPFVHFFDGFRTSHEINTIDIFDDEKFTGLINYDKLNEYKNRILTRKDPHQFGMAENEDIYFQSIEARNTLYNEMPDIVNNYMQKINEIAGTDYKPFNYYGASDASDVIILMGSSYHTAKQVVQKRNELGFKTGVVCVNLFRPFSKKYLLNVLPSTVKNIAVLDKAKLPGSTAEALYHDVLSSLDDKNIFVCHGRYGISSKNVTTSQINAVYENLINKEKTEFTIGIVDDVTNLSLTDVDIDIVNDSDEIKIYGFGSDGMVSASKEIIKILSDKFNKYVQGYFEYDSKKSGGVTVSNLRISDNVINKPYYVENPKIIVVTKDEYFKKFNMIDNIKENGILLINTIKNEQEINEMLSNKDKEIIRNKNVKVYYINATKIAYINNMPGKINKIMELILLKLFNIDNAFSILEENIKSIFKTKGETVINNNINSIKMAEDELKILNNLIIDNDKKEEEKDYSVIDIINRRQGNSLPVSKLLKYSKGSFECGLSKYEKRSISETVAMWDSEKCIMCNKCSFICPHSVIRPLLINEEGKDSIIDKDKKFFLAISEKDCTSCTLCSKVCPTGAISYGEGSVVNRNICDKYFDTHENDFKLPVFNVKGSQFKKSKFEFSGACAGCGEAAYIKLLTQLFGDKIIIANATGCSSIYGGSAPSTPYLLPWANSLFEDNAEFAFGIHNSYQEKRNNLLNNMKNNNINIEDISKIELPSLVKDDLNYLDNKTVWAIGGDGWAYDIGFSGIDHVLSSGENIKILVLDTEVYSNTGGQSSKSSRIGQVSEFADFGKKTYKKDLFKIAMCYPNTYVASVNLNADMQQTLKAFKEADEHNGPSIIIAYSPCVEHGIKGGMSNSYEEAILSIECGYSILMRYNPSEDKLYIDSKKPNFDLYHDFLENEVRYKSLFIKDQNLANKLLDKQKNNAIKRYEYYSNLVK